MKERQPRKPAAEQSRQSAQPSGRGGARNAPNEETRPLGPEQPSSSPNDSMPKSGPTPARKSARLQAYKSRLILFPRKAGQYKKLDSTPEEVKAAAAGGIKNVSAAFPVSNPTAAESITAVPKGDISAREKSAFRTLRDARSDARNFGAREKRAKAKAEEAEAAKK
ncbi:60S ribosomal protein L13 [Ascosphaera pollenicola]|nr:60S ribosomal protein L13 [Ascosphaera pollenicola]